MIASGEILRWATDYRIKNVQPPTHVALTDEEWHGLLDEFGEHLHHFDGGTIKTIWGLEIVRVKEPGNLRVWRSKPDEPLEKFSSCGCCGASWLPECNYCGRIG